MTVKPKHSSQAMDTAWKAYAQGLEDVRQILLNHAFAEGEREQAEAHYLFYQLQAEVFDVTMAPRGGYPRLYGLFPPLTYTWALPNPDFIYSRLYLDGKRTYRLHGVRSNSRFIAIQAINGHLTLPPDRLKLFGDFDMDEFEIGPGGAFEITLSAEKPATGNWIPLDPQEERNFVFIREALADWEVQQPSEMHIEVIDGQPRGPVALTEADMIRRLDDAVRFLKTIAAGLSIKPIADAIEIAGGRNKFAQPKIAGAAAASAYATYNIMGFEIAPGQALIIELDLPEPRYWNIQAGDTWMQTLDYAYHQSSLNMSQAAVDADGKVRVVLSAEDPGVQNWLDPVDSRKGMVMVRWYRAQRQALPTTKLVPLAELAQHLPADTVRISPDARQAVLKARQAAVERRGNFY